ncbi:MAG: thiamine-phosphate kinase [Acidobacteria bacterium]|nr:thiamine-phosphate kinase [Acidobacteriota bacterium]
MQGLDRAEDPFVRLGIGDDAALCRPRAGWELAVTTDLLVEGRHFRFGTASPEDVGWKTAASNLSDLAAMGADPVAFFLGAAFPPDRGPRFQRLMAGLAACLKAFGAPLAGGDLSAAGRFCLCGTAIGEVPAGSALRRDGARPGDVIAVSGCPGLSGAGLRLLRAGWRLRGGKARTTGAADTVPEPVAADPTAVHHCLAAHLRPVPRLSLGRYLREDGGVSAAMDLSDGIAADLPRIGRRSGVAARLDAGSLDALVRRNPCLTLADVLGGGEDYELLFTAPPACWERLILTAACRPGLPPLTAVGTVVKGTPGEVLLREGRRTHPLPVAGFDHFRPAR